MKIENKNKISFRNVKSLLKDVSDYALGNATNKEYAALLMIGSILGMIACLIGIFCS